MKRDDCLQIKQDAANGAGLWAVFLFYMPLHHFRTEADCVPYRDRVWAAMVKGFGASCP